MQVQNETLQKLTWNQGKQFAVIIQTHMHVVS